jgi:hypothetical protein
MNDMKTILTNLKTNNPNIVELIDQLETKMVEMDKKGEDFIYVYYRFFEDIELSEEDYDTLGLTDGVMSDKEMYDNLSLLKTLVLGTNTITITGHGNKFDLTVNGRYITGGNKESIVKSLHQVMTNGYLVETV